MKPNKCRLKIPERLIHHLLYVCILCFLSNLYAQNDIWKVGVARVNITPIDSLWLAGYASRDHVAEGKLHDLWAKALAFEDQEGNRAVMVTADILGFPKNMSDNIRSQCLEKYNLSKSQIILSSSHTHSGPALRKSLMHVYPLNDVHLRDVEVYSEKLESQIVDLVGRALGDKKPARLYSDNGVVRFQVNRRNNNAKNLSEQTDLNGPNDFAVPVLQVKDLQDKLVALLFGYACHPTVLNSYQWSGDYPGYAQLALEDRYPGVTALFFQGCGADQNPLPRRTVSLARQYGQELAAAVSRVVEENQPALVSGMKTGYREIDLKLSSLPSDSALEEFVNSTNSDYQKRWGKIMLETRDNAERPKDSYPYPVQMWKLGNQSIITLGGEVVVDYAITIKRLFGEETFVMGYCNDVMAYIPTLKILREGGYEGCSSQIVYGLPSTWRADIESQIIAAVIKLAGKTGIEMYESNLIPESGNY